MKKIALIALIGASCSYIKAQVTDHLNNNNSPTRTFLKITNQNSLNGGLLYGINNGNANGNNGFITLKENKSLLFSTFDIERMRILNNGNVGIGLTTPITLLDVNGQATVRVLTKDSISTKIVVADSLGTLFYRDAADFMIGGTGEDDDWSGAGTGQMFVTDINDRVSIGATSTTFKFEVVNDFINNNIATAGRFRTNATGKSGGNGVLALVLNGNGNKIAVEGRSINNDNSTTANNVGVRGSGESVGLSNSNTGVRAISIGNSNLNIGVQSIVDPNASVQYGVQSTTRAGAATIQNLGMRSIAQGTTSSTSVNENAGVRAEGWHSPGVINNYGIRAFAITAASGTPGTPSVNYGIFATATGSTTGIQRAGFFQGDLEVTGSIINPSDRKLKKNINQYEGALAIINKLSPKTYNYKQNIGNMNLPENKQWGFIAQELQEVLPELVFTSRLPESTDASGKVITPAMDYKSVNYLPLIPILVQAAKEQQMENKLLREELEDLKENLAKSKSTENYNSSFVNENRLEQNKPNPFAESTVIEYQIANNANSAHIYIYNMNGKQLKKVEIDKGKTSLNLKSGELTPGMYIYALIVDGKETSTKKMIITD